MATENELSTAGKRAWYVIHTYSGYENKVKANLEHKVQTLGMEDQIFNVMVPMDDETELTPGGTPKTVKRKVFPGYVLVEMIVTNHSWYVVRNTPGVTGFVGSEKEPIPLTEEEAQRILSTVQDESGEAAVHIDVQSGDEVNIIDGPFKNCSGRVTSVDYEGACIVVLVNMFGGDTEVEVDFDQVEKIDAL